MMQHTSNGEMEHICLISANSKSSMKSAYGKTEHITTSKAAI